MGYKIHYQFLKALYEMKLMDIYFQILFIILEHFQILNYFMKISVFSIISAQISVKHCGLLDITMLPLMASQANGHGISILQSVMTCMYKIRFMKWFYATV